MRLPIAFFGALAGVMTLANTIVPAHGQTYKQIFSFPVGRRGNVPQGSLTKFRDMLIGVTQQGGPETNCYKGCGTIYSLHVSTGLVRVVHTFKTAADGSSPQSNLTKVGHLLYGTTAGGGAGTVYSIDPVTHVENIVYSFRGLSKGSTDGVQPASGLLSVGEILYGVTYAGGAENNGTVYSLDLTTGTEAVVYAFKGSTGEGPSSNLVAIGTLLYGTTVHGGDQGAGSVYSVNVTTGAETVVHSFGDKKNDGVYPLSGLTRFGSKLYGTTEFGGTGNKGCIFEIDPDTTFEKVVYSFSPPDIAPDVDGLRPYSDLIERNGVLYGTTFQGGPYQTQSLPGYGTVFSFNVATKAETILYAFKGGTDGSYPRDGLTEFRGALYGETDDGGVEGEGTIYAVTP